MAFFSLKTPADMLAKARREHDRLLSEISVDTLFNFFVTAYHVRDYVLKAGAVSQAQMEEFMKDADMLACRDLCDKGKHMILTKRADPSTTHTHVSGGWGDAPWGAAPWGGSLDHWILTTEANAVDVGPLARRVLEKWEAFFVTHRL